MNFEHFPIEIFYVLMAVIGGVARYLNSYVQGERFNFAIFLASAFVSGFGGLMFAFLGQSMNMPQPMIYVMAGIGGFFSEQTLKLIFERVTNKSLSDLNKK